MASAHAVNAEMDEYPEFAVCKFLPGFLVPGRGESWRLGRCPGTHGEQQGHGCKNFFHDDVFLVNNNCSIVYGCKGSRFRADKDDVAFQKRFQR